MTATETPLVFSCDGDDLIGILHRPDAPRDTAVVVVVGGPQYRIGSHRQFLLLARAVAEAGFPVLRFDYRGMGDSEGDFRGFEDAGEDIRQALEAFSEAMPEVRRFVLWGLCDGASAILFYAAGDPRVERVVLLNPWVRTEAGQARAMLKHHYLARLTSRDFWGKLLSGKVALGSSLRDFAGTLVKRLAGSSKRSGTADEGGGSADASLPDRMAAGLKRFAGPVLLILSGKDLTAREFEDAAKLSPLWQSLLHEERVTIERLPEADHTFSQAARRQEVETMTCDWLRKSD